MNGSSLSLEQSFNHQWSGAYLKHAPRASALALHDLPTYCCKVGTEYNLYLL